MEVATLWGGLPIRRWKTAVCGYCQAPRIIVCCKRSEMVDLDQEKYVLGIGIRPEDIDDFQAVDLELVAGDVSIDNPTIIHGANANHTEQWRVGLTLRYIPTTTMVTTEGHESVFCCGQVDAKTGNLYAERPVFVAGEHMSFTGCDVL